MAIRASLEAWGARFAGARSGAGAVEFALVLPFLALILLAGSELSAAMTVDRKVKEAAGFAADLVSQSTQLAEPDLQKILVVSRQALDPYHVQPLRMRVVQAKVTPDGRATVDWSCQTTGYPRLQAGSPVAVPPNFTVKPPSPAGSSTVGDFYILYGEAEYEFQPVTGQVFHKSVTLKGETFLLPRFSPKVDAPGCATFAF